MVCHPCVSFLATGTTQALVTKQPSQPSSQLVKRQGRTMHVDRRLAGSMHSSGRECGSLVQEPYMRLLATRLHTIPVYYDDRMVADAQSYSPSSGKPRAVVERG